MTRAELAALVGAMRTPAPAESPLKDLGSINSFKAVDFYFDHSYEVYPPSAKPGEYQVGGPTAVFADASDAAAYIALRNHAAKLLAVCEAAEGLLKVIEADDVPGYIYDECWAECVGCGNTAGTIAGIQHEWNCLQFAIDQLRAALRDLEGE